MKFLVLLLSVCFVTTAFAGIKHHNHWGTHLQVGINLEHPEIAKSKQAPEEILVEKAKDQNYYLKVIKTERSRSGLLVEVAIPKSANKDMYIKFLKNLKFVKGVVENKRA